MRHPIDRKASPLMTALKEQAGDATALATRMQAMVPDGTTRLLAMMAAARLLAHFIYETGESEDDDNGWPNWIAACLLMLARLAREEREIRRPTANAVRATTH